MQDLVQRAQRPAATEDYTAADIEVLEGLEPVRRRPGMFIGGTDERAALVGRFRNHTRRHSLAPSAQDLEQNRDQDAD